MARILKNSYSLNNLYRISRNYSPKIFRSFIYERKNNLNLVYFSQIMKYSSYVASQAVQHDDHISYTSENLMNRNNLILKEIEDNLSFIDSQVRQAGKLLKRDVDSLFSKIKTLDSISSFHSLCLLRCCNRIYEEIPENRIALANEIWTTLKKMGSVFDVRHFNSLLKTYLDCGHNFSPIEFLTLMEKENIEPNKITYLYLMDKFSNDGNLSGASTILEYMKEKGFAINEDAFNSLIKCHAKSNDFAGAENMLDVMRKANLKPSSQSYTNILIEYAKLGNIEKIQSMFAELQESISFTENDYFHIIKAFANGGHEEYVDMIIEKMDIEQGLTHERIIYIMELINSDFEHIAYKLVLAFSKVDSHSATNVFIKHLIKKEKDFSKLNYYIDDIISRELNKNILLNATKHAIEIHRIDHAFELFEKLQEKGIPFRRRTFCQFLDYFKQQKFSEGIWSILKLMYKYGLPLDMNTYLKFVFPALDVSSPDDVIYKIQNSGHSLPVAIDALFQYYCSIGQLNNAAYLLKKYDVQMNFKFILNEFLNLYPKYQQNPDLYLDILKYAIENPGLPGQNFEALSEKIFSYMIETNFPLFAVFFDKLKDEGFVMKNKIAVALEPLLKKRAPEYLGHLHSMIEDQSNISTKDKKIEYFKKLSSKEIEENMTFIEQKGFPKNFIRLQLLYAYIKEKDIDKLTKAIKNFEEIGFELIPNIYSQMLSLYCEINNLEEACNIKNILSQKYPSYKVEAKRLMEYLTLLLKYSKLDDVLNIIEKEFKEIYLSGSNDLFIRNLKKFLNTVAETGDVKFVENVVTKMLNSSFPGLKEIILEPLIKFHVFKQDFNTAIEEYKKCILKYKVFPCLNYLMMKLIIAGDYQLLQKVVDLTTVYGGKKMALYELVAVLLETKHIAEASNAIQKLDQVADKKYLDDICKRFFNQNKILELETFLHLTKMLVHLDRDIIYYYLLKLHVMNKDYKRALNAWENLKEENVQPSTKTLEFVSHFLKKENQNSPHNISEKEEFYPDDDLVDSSAVNTFLNYLDNRNVTQALQELHRLKKGHVRLLSLENMSKLIELVIEENCIAELRQNVNAMSYIIENDKEIIKPIMQKFSDAGDVESMKSLSILMPDFSLKNSYFNFFLNKAFILSERHEELMSFLEKHKDKKNKLFSVYGFQELLKKPELEERIMNLVEYYLKELKLDAPISAVWAYYFCNEDYSKADEISKKYPISARSADSSILKTIRATRNIDMGRKYIDFVKQHPSTPRTRDRAYGVLLDVFLDKGMYDEAATLVTESKNNNSDLSISYNSSLLNLKSALEKENKYVPFTVKTEGFDVESSSDTK